MTSLLPWMHNKVVKLKFDKNWNTEREAADYSALLCARLGQLPYPLELHWRQLKKNA